MKFYLQGKSYIFTVMTVYINYTLWSKIYELCFGYLFVDKAIKEVHTVYCAIENLWTVLWVPTWGWGYQSTLKSVLCHQTPPNYALGTYLGMRLSEGYTYRVLCHQKLWTVVWLPTWGWGYQRVHISVQNFGCARDNQKSRWTTKNADAVVQRTTISFDAPAVKLNHSHYCVPRSM